MNAVKHGLTTREELQTLQQLNKLLHLYELSLADIK
jgi:hypothetical protein